MLKRTHKNIRERKQANDPRDTPPPTIFGEELDQNIEDTPPIYFLSDFHIGSNYKRGSVNKTLSNDQKSTTLEKFLEWLDYVDNDAKDYPYYDVVMNGDFLDLYQASSGSKVSYQEGLKHILKTNIIKIPTTGSTKTINFFDAFAQKISSKPRMRFYYLIGNHDDPFYKGDQKGDKKGSTVTGFGHMFGAVMKKKVKRALGNSHTIVPFAMQMSYENSNYYLFAEHGHRHESHHFKDGNKECAGAKVAKLINQMQEMSFENWTSHLPVTPKIQPFKNIEWPPEYEMAKHLRCIVKMKPGYHASLDPALEAAHNAAKKLIDRLIITAIKAKYPTLSAFAPIIHSKESLAKKVLEELKPKNFINDAREWAKEIRKKDGKSKTRIVIFGHTHFIDLRPAGRSHWAYANSGSWLDRSKSIRKAGKCYLQLIPSNYPFIKVSTWTRESTNEKYANVELINYRDLSRVKSVLVYLHKGGK